GLLWWGTDPAGSSKQFHLPQAERPGPHGKGGQVEVFGKPQLAAQPGTGAARHGHALGGIVFGVTTGT
ncbi:MAG: hypothetical protein M3021_06965, partial [Actinomycetota bacterium]|nr:hypothetical protein [Actinomycetota bacterium]